VQFFYLALNLVNLKIDFDMAQIKIVLLDDSGTEITTRFYDLSNNLEQLHDMEREIESLRPSILGDITHDLLDQAQVSDEKKE
jgi:hypothetical protein